MTVPEPPRGYRLRVTGPAARALAERLPEKVAAGGVRVHRDDTPRQLSDDDESMGFKISKEERAELVAAEPEKYFFIPSHDVNFSFARLRLAAVEVDELREVITEAWRLAHNYDAHQ